MNSRPALFTPDGRLIQKDEILDRATPRHVTKMLREWFVQFAAFQRKHAIGTHCGLCHLTLTPINAWRHWGDCEGHKPIAEDGIAEPIVKTNAGLAWVTGRTVSKVELKPDAIEWFRQAQDVYGHFLLGLHCEKCHADFVGLNADSDPIFSTACACREFIGNNREYVAPAAEILH